MIDFVRYIVEALLSLAVFVMMARLLLQLTRADFRNPLAQAIVQLTNPLIVPLRRVLPPIGKVDTASVVAILLVAALEVSVQHRGPWIDLLDWLDALLRHIARMLLSIYLYAIILYALLSMIAPGGYSPLQSVLAALCEPVLRPFRRIIPPISGLDLSPLWATLIILALLNVPGMWR